MMSEKEMERLYELLEKVEDEYEKAELKHAIYVIESNFHIY